MSRSIEEQIRDVDEQIEKLNEKRKKLVEKQRKIEKEKEEKEARELMKLLKEIKAGGKTDIEKIKADLKELYNVNIPSSDKPKEDTIAVNDNSKVETNQEANTNQ